METIKILDNYKVRLTEDPLHLKVLSVIFLHYKISEAKLLKIIPELKKRMVILSELFKAGLIENQSTENFFSLTTKAEKILENFNIDSILIREFLDNLPINEYDKIFLDKSVEYFDQFKTNNKDLSTLLRTLCLFSNAIQNKKYDKIINDNAFIIIFHYNTYDLNLSKNILLNEIKSRIISDNDISTETKEMISKRQYIYKKKIDYCHTSFKLSNSLHFPAQREYWLENKLDKETSFLTILRHTSNYYHGYCDSELFNLTQFDDIISPFNFSKMELDIASNLTKYFSNHKVNVKYSFSIETLILQFFNLKESYNSNNKSLITFVPKLEEKKKRKRKK